MCIVSRLSNELRMFGHAQDLVAECGVHCERHFFLPSGSPILRPALWLGSRWSGRSPRCWAWSWRGWSRARAKAGAGKPMAALAPATRYKRPLWGEGAPADGATCCNSFFLFFPLSSFQIPHTATRKTWCKPEISKQSCAVIPAWSPICNCCLVLFIYLCYIEWGWFSMFF